MQHLAAHTGFEPRITTLRVNLYDLGFDAAANVFANIRLERRVLQRDIHVTVTVGDDEWCYSVEDGVAEATGDEPEWMAAVLDYADVDLVGEGR